MSTACLYPGEYGAQDVAQESLDVVRSPAMNVRGRAPANRPHVVLTAMAVAVAGED